MDRTRTHASPAFPLWGFLRHVPLAPEGAAATGAPAAPAAAPATLGAGVAAAAAAPKGDAPAAPAAKADAPKAEAAPVAKPEAKAEPAKADKAPEPAKPEAKVDDPYAKLLARLEAQDAEIAALKSTTAKAAKDAEDARGDVRARAVDELLASASLQPKYYKAARAEIGTLDPKSDAAKAKVDAFVKEFPESVLPRAQATKPDSAWIDRIGERQKDAKSTRGTMLGAISAADLQAQIAQARGGR